jgi:hypothetical protein
MYIKVSLIPCTLEALEPTLFSPFCSSDDHCATPSWHIPNVSFTSCKGNLYRVYNVGSTFSADIQIAGRLNVEVQIADKKMCTKLN